MTQAITVLGAGSWGTALAIALARNGQRTRLWGHNPQHIQAMQATQSNERFLAGIAFPENLSVFDDLATALDECQDVLIVVPSVAFRSTLVKAQPFIKPKMGIAWGTKGIDHDSGALLHEVVTEICGAHPMAIISGPSFAKEVAQGLPTAITLAGTDAAYNQHLQQRFHQKNFRVYISEDLIGVQISGTVKNVLAIATGMCDGLALGANARSALITRGLSELVRLGIALGGSYETFMGLAGIGDLILTCTDNQSRNRRFGLALGKGETTIQAEQAIGQVVEGIKNAAEIYKLAQQVAVEMPICNQVYQVIQGEVSVAQAAKNLLSRELPKA